MINRHVVFQFDERSYDSLEKLKEQGHRFVQIKLVDPITKETTNLYIPDIKKEQR